MLKAADSGTVNRFYLSGMCIAWIFPKNTRTICLDMVFRAKNENEREKKNVYEKNEIFVGSFVGC